jgi:hypothetical protein
MNATEEVFKFGFQRLLSGYSRQGRGAVRAKVCEAWGVSHQRYYQIVNAKAGDSVNLSAEQAIAAARILSVSVDEILTPSEMMMMDC